MLITLQWWFGAGKKEANNVLNAYVRQEQCCLYCIDKHTENSCPHCGSSRSFHSRWHLKYKRFDAGFTLAMWLRHSISARCVNMTLLSPQKHKFKAALHSTVSDRAPTPLTCSSVHWGTLTQSCTVSLSCNTIEYFPPYIVIYLQ